MARIRSVQIEVLPPDREASHFDCTIYVLREGQSSNYKIGIAQHPRRRLISLQCGNPRRLHLIAAYEGPRSRCLEIERICHRYFKTSPKTEWFHFDGEPDLIIEFLNSFSEESVQ